MNFYQFLQIDPEASTEFIEYALRYWSQKYHPDKGGSHQDMCIVNDAKKHLLDEITRKKYNEEYGVVIKNRHGVSPNRGKATLDTKQAVDFLRSKGPGIKAWNQFRKHENTVPSLRGVDLSKCCLRGANLIGIDFVGANLAESDLSDTNISGSDLSNAILMSADLSGVNLSKSELLNANLEKANLWGANLSHSNLTNAKLAGTCLAKADISHAKLESADMSHSWIMGANFSRSDLSNSKLVGAKNYQLYVNDRNELTIRSRKGHYSDSEYNKIVDCSISEWHKKIVTADIQYKYVKVNFSECCLISAILTQAVLAESDFSNANLELAVLDNVNMGGAKLSGVKIYNVKSVYGAVLPDLS